MLIVVLLWDILNCSWEKDWEKVRKMYPESQNMSQDTTLYLLIAEKIWGKDGPPTMQTLWDEGHFNSDLPTQKEEYFIVPVAGETRRVASLNSYKKHLTKIKIPAFGRNEQNHQL